MSVMFAIAFVGRSGSSYLEGRIDAHPDASCQGEILWPLLENAQSASLPEWLDESVRPGNLAAAGFKLPREHLMGIPQIVPILLERRYKIIRLFRRNKLDQFISMRLAQLNNMWTSEAGTYRVQEMDVDPDYLAATIADFQVGDEFLRKALDDFDVLPVAYEDLTTEEGWTGICSFLGLPVSHEPGRFRRQRRGSQREIVRNYDEVRERFRGTPIGAFFED